jgi:hypothetical protein
MKKRGTDLQKHYRQAFDYWVRITGGRPRYVVLCNFDSKPGTPKNNLALTTRHSVGDTALSSPGPKSVTTPCRARVNST